MGDKVEAKVCSYSIHPGKMSKLPRGDEAVPAPLLERTLRQKTDFFLMAGAGSDTFFPGLPATPFRPRMMLTGLGRLGEATFRLVGAS